MKGSIVKYIGIGILVILITGAIIQMIQTFFFIKLASGVVLCSKEDEKTICSKINKNLQFYIAFYDEGIHGYEKQAKVILKNNFIFPNIYGEEVVIEDNDNKRLGTVCQYIKENDNSNYALFICVLPHLMVGVICLIILFKILIPRCK